MNSRILKAPTFQRRPVAPLKKNLPSRTATQLVSKKNSSAFEVLLYDCLCMNQEIIQRICHSEISGSNYRGLLDIRLVSKNCHKAIELFVNRFLCASGFKGPCLESKLELMCLANLLPLYIIAKNIDTQEATNFRKIFEKKILCISRCIFSAGENYIDIWMNRKLGLTLRLDDKLDGFLIMQFAQKCIYADAYNFLQENPEWFFSFCKRYKSLKDIKYIIAILINELFTKPSWDFKMEICFFQELMNQELLDDECKNLIVEKCVPVLQSKIYKVHVIQFIIHLIQLKKVSLNEIFYMFLRDEGEMGNGEALFLYHCIAEKIITKENMPRDASCIIKEFKKSLCEALEFEAICRLILEIIKQQIFNKSDIETLKRFFLQNETNDGFKGFRFMFFEMLAICSSCENDILKEFLPFVIMDFNFIKMNSKNIPVYLEFFKQDMILKDQIETIIVSLVNKTLNTMKFDIESLSFFVIITKKKLLSAERIIQLISVYGDMPNCLKYNRLWHMFDTDNFIENAQIMSLFIPLLCRHNLTIVDNRYIKKLLKILEMFLQERYEYNFSEFVELFTAYSCEVANQRLIDDVVARNLLIKCFKRLIQHKLIEKVPAIIENYWEYIPPVNDTIVFENIISSSAYPIQEMVHNDVIPNIEILPLDNNISFQEACRNLWHNFLACATPITYSGSLSLLLVVLLYLKMCQ